MGWLGPPHSQPGPLIQCCYYSVVWLSICCADTWVARRRRHHIARRLCYLKISDLSLRMLWRNPNDGWNVSAWRHHAPSSVYLAPLTRQGNSPWIFSWLPQVLTGTLELHYGQVHLAIVWRTSLFHAALHGTNRWNSGQWRKPSFWAEKKQKNAEAAHPPVQRLWPVLGKRWDLMFCTSRPGGLYISHTRLHPRHTYLPAWVFLSLYWLLCKFQLRYRNFPLTHLPAALSSTVSCSGSKLNVMLRTVHAILICLLHTSTSVDT